jgi:WD40 repeat protein
MVLEKDSSVLGYPGEISKPLDADHHGVCKYTSPQDPRYITIRNVLKTLIAKAKVKGKLMTSNSASYPLIYSSINVYVKDMLTSWDLLEQSVEVDGSATISFEQYLSVSESPETDYNFFRDRWTPGTCLWIEQNDTFKAWAEDATLAPRVLWINGNAASGKSILSSFIINHLVQLGLPCQYYFIRFMSEDNRGLSMLLRSLACQLANSTPTYGEKLGLLDVATADLKTADYRTIWQWLFKQTLFHLNLDYPIYWIIDGLDEAERPASLIRLLSELQHITVPLRILIVSRKTHDINSAFQKMAGQVRLDTLRTEGNIVDFRSYIDREMELTDDTTYREDVTRKLLDRAQGNFLWLHLAVLKINGCYTRPDVERALNELPSGMEALYNRMAESIQSQPHVNDQRLGLCILGWTTCARRLLVVEELGDALENNGVLEIRRTIGDLCGGFVAVDNDGKVAMIHETAREYLMCGGKDGQSLSIDRKTTNDMIFKRCMSRLMETSLRSQINQNRTPALLGYSVTSWSHHLVLGSATDTTILEIVMNFLGGPHVLTWIYVAARARDLRALVTASRHLVEVTLKLRKMGDEECPIHRHAAEVMERWATDLVKIVGKFGNSLTQYPESIYKLIPPFCPENSMVYQQFGRKETRTLHVSGFTSNTWDDSLARFSQPQGVVASSVITAGSRIAVLTVIRKLSQVIIYNAVTFELQRRITHPERVLTIQSNNIGDLLVTYGYMTTRLWNLTTGECLKTIQNPPRRPRPRSILFDEKRMLVLACYEDRRIRSFSLEDNQSDQWDMLVHIEEQSLYDNIVSFPITASVSPDGNRVAFGYRNHPVTAWELEPPMLIGHCNIPLNADDMTIEGNTWGEVFHLTWHPRSNEVIGLTQVGLLFLWDPYEEEASATVHTGADTFTVNTDGSLVATGDAVGVIKVYTVAGFSMLYQLASQDPVHCLRFSVDSRRLYDTRGSYGNVWEPNALVRLADCSDHSSSNDSYSESGSIARVSLYDEHHFARVDSVIALSGQSVGPLYCYGTEDGVAILCEAGRGKVGELERLTSYMPIEHVAWSEDGRYAALVDLSGRLAVKTVTRSIESPSLWQVISNFDLVLPQEQSHVTQLMFHPTGKHLFACTSTILFAIDLQSQSLVESRLDPSLSKMKWANHPTAPDSLLGFSTTNVYLFSWRDLQQRETYTYSPPRVDVSSGISVPPCTLGRTGNLQKDSEAPGRLISSTDSPHILLEICLSSAVGENESQYLLFDVDKIQRGVSDIISNQATLAIPYTPLPHEVTARIREPLAFLSRGRLAFLDIDRWICTWRLPISHSVRPQVRKLSEPGIAGIEQYYFLPGDWLSSNETRLCTVTPDGTLLCPRNGEVASVQSSKLRK